MSRSISNILFANCLAVAVLPHDFGPFIKTAPEEAIFSMKSPSINLGKYFMVSYLFFLQRYIKNFIVQKLDFLLCKN
jgi:hypothetical protein